MPFDITGLVSPKSTALVISEMQQTFLGNGGDLAVNALAVLPNVVRLADAARASGVQVVHCVKVFRRDTLARNTNLALYKRRGMTRAEGELPPEPDSRPVEGTEVVAELGPDERDLVMTRLHGMGAIYDTGVDPVLRTLGVSTVVVAGISLNVGIPNTVMDFANRGYEVVVARDGVAGTPLSYGELMIENTIKMLATVTTTDALIAAWTKR